MKAVDKPVTGYTDMSVTRSWEIEQTDMDIARLYAAVNDRSAVMEFGSGGELRVRMDGEIVATGKWTDDGDDDESGTHHFEDEDELDDQLMGAD